jgi:calcineurin-like phosphoesterase family protein
MQRTNTYFTSDTHFGHHNIRKFCPETRLGDTTEEMDRLLIECWNATVPPNGTVYHLGDFSFAENDEDIKKVVKKLHGRIHLILGNHDTIIEHTASLRAMFASVQHYKRIALNRHKIIMFHYPARSWDKMRAGAYHLFGHVHGALDGQPHGRSMDVGIDARPNGDMRPWSFEEIDEILSQRPILTDNGD